MAYFLFVDESGQDHKASPYEVLAGVAVEDRHLWNLVRAIQEAEERLLGRRYSQEKSELKAQKLINRKTFRKVNQLPPIPPSERRVLAKSCLDFGATAGKREITALAQAKLGYVNEVLEICNRFRCKVFASIVSPDALRPDSKTYLRKDYAFIFERFFYFLEDQTPEAFGIVVFDELEKSQSHILVSQMDNYFKKTAKGRMRASLIIPEPLFVHSDLTTGIQLADLVAYTLSWGFRNEKLTALGCTELNDLVSGICAMRYVAEREIDDNPNFKISSLKYLITDLRESKQQDEN
jgi:hypothetical protein